MAVTRRRIEKNLETIRQNIDEACRLRGRDPRDVTVVAVTKSVEVETIRNLLDAGLTELGESRVQQFVSRAEELQGYLARRRTPLPAPVKWHLIGHLQRNKVKSALKYAGLIHSIDSLRLAEELNTCAEKLDKTVEVLLQVNCSQESQKFGCAVGAATHLGEMIASMKNLRLAGLMTMAPLSDDEGEIRHTFVRLRELFEEMHREQIGGESFRHLSMGMSHDYRIAVEEGATICRIGSALFE